MMLVLMVVVCGSRVLCGCAAAGGARAPTLDGATLARAAPPTASRTREAPSETRAHSSFPLARPPLSHLSVHSSSAPSLSSFLSQTQLPLQQTPSRARHGTAQGEGRGRGRPAPTTCRCCCSASPRHQQQRRRRRRRRGADRSGAGGAPDGAGAGAGEGGAGLRHARRGEKGRPEREAQQHRSSGTTAHARVSSSDRARARLLSMSRTHLEDIVQGAESSRGRTETGSDDTPGFRSV